MAQNLRAILFASATATRIFGLRASIRASHEPGAAGLRFATLTCDIAPMIKSLRMSACPAFDTRPCRSFPPEENCRGTSPSQAAKSRPDRNVVITGANASIASAIIGPTPSRVRGLPRRTTPEERHRDKLALIEACQRRINHFFGVHHDTVRKFADGDKALGKVMSSLIAPAYRQFVEK